MTGDVPGGVVRHRGLAFWVGAGAGWALIAWGVRGIFVQRIHTRPGQLLRFFATGLAAHDLLFAPLVLAAGVLIARAVPARWRSPAQAALLMAGPAAMYAYPLVRGYGRSLHNPTSLPHNYAAGLIIVLAAVWAGVLAARLVLSPTARPRSAGPRMRA